MSTYSLYILIFFIANGTIFAAAVPILKKHHPLLTSPLFNTPLSPCPVNSGSIFRRADCTGFFFADPNWCIPPPPASPAPPMRGAEDIHSRSNNEAPVDSSPDDPVSTATVTAQGEPASVTLASTPTPPSPSSSEDLSATTVFVPAESSLTPSTVAAPFTTTVTMTLQVTTLTLEPSTVTVTALLSGGSPSSKTGGVGVQSITILETVPFTTTDLPAVTVTGLQTLTSVVVVPMEETATVNKSWAAATPLLPVRIEAAKTVVSGRE
ncbi:hypothetical protein N657DRAFT_639990 [Parathielavia appendiculata]|uniref:Uncharacterized protein n=1 Tax=Parathielavia appendiculata TaxID=2587402 RepID=A0AAN6UAY1_9PEZI|nr:hypothetical protein N657DRAFT_639990 [Parathielavia appendiculata]